MDERMIIRAEAPADCAAIRSVLVSAFGGVAEADLVELLRRERSIAIALVAEIAGAAQEQASGLQEVNSAVGEMDQATQQNAAMAEQSTAAAHSLSQEADRLSALVSRFQLGGDVAGLKAMARTMQAAIAPAQAAAPRPAKPRASKANGSAAMAPRQDAEARDKGWEEF